MTKRQLRDLFPEGTRVEITNHYINRPDHPCYGTRLARVTRNTSGGLWIDDSRIKWPKMAQVARNADAGITLFGGGINQKPEEPFVTLQPV